ncbi:MAG: hypothetical protein RLZZ241_1916 [Bacteroidota bacterium]|jgi:hypothetical protein
MSHLNPKHLQILVPYPIGQFCLPAHMQKETLSYWIGRIQVFPDQLRQLVLGWEATQLDTPYRPDGWTVRQLIHHLADSHQHAFIRFKWALTEENPEIKAYDEKAWARLVDATSGPILPALDQLQALHSRWVYLLRSLNALQLNRTFRHPETGKTHALWEQIGQYAWHGAHHLAHIKNLKTAMGWSD